MPAPASKVLRLDAYTGSLGKPKKLRGGRIRVDGHFTKPGVFQYFDQVLGKTVREYRPSAEVFKADSLDSWKRVPLSIGHPGDLVTNDTWRMHTVGVLGDDVRQDGALAAASMDIAARPAVDGLASGKLSELSGGYWCELDETPGVTSGDPHVPDGIRFDRSQKSIEGNHVALLPRGDARLGRDMAMRLDAKGHQITSQRAFRTDSKETDMKTTFLGKTYDLDDAGDRALFNAAVAEDEKARTARADSDAAIAKERDEAKGRADALEKQLAEANAKTAAAEQVAKLDALQAEAVQVLGEDAGKKARQDAKTPEDLSKAIRAGMEAAVKAAYPDEKLDGESDGYVRGLYKGLRVDAERADASIAGVRVAAVMAQGTGGAPTTGSVIRAFQDQVNHDIEHPRASAK